MSDEIDFWDEEWITEEDSIDGHNFSFHFSPDQSSSKSSYQSANDISLEYNAPNGSGYSSSQSKQLYLQFLEENAPSFITIEQLKTKTPDLITNTEGFTLNIYGVIKEVYDLRSEATPYNPFEVNDKYITLIDPSSDDGFRVRLEKPSFYFDVGDILRIRNMQIVQGLNAVEYYSEKNDEIRIIKCLEFSYKEGETKNDCDCNVEQTIAYYLEKWYARKIFSECRLNKLPVPKTRFPHYVNLVCQVLSKQVLQQSVVLRIYDGTFPNRQFDYEESVKYINAIKPLNPIETRVYRDKTLKLHENVSDDKLKSSAVINIWGNESGTNCNHFNTANSLKLVEGRDLLLLLNVEVTQIADGPLAILVMRSGRHKGKAVRKVNKDSVLGKLITEAMTTSESSRESRRKRRKC